MPKIVIAIVLLAHGIGHVLGPMQVLTSVIGQSLSQVIGLALWAAALVGFALLAGVVIRSLPAAWWTRLAVAASLVSLAAIALFATEFPPRSTFGAVVIDAAVLVSVLLIHWEPSDIAA